MIIKAQILRKEPVVKNSEMSWLSPCGNNVFLDNYFTFAEFSNVLNSTQAKVASRIDGVDNKIIQELPSKYKLLPLDIFNGMHQKSEFPNDWQYTIVLTVEKPDGNSVRPLALTSCSCKIFEKLIKNGLQWWVEHNDHLPKSQSGFRKGRSCYDNLAYFTSDIDVLSYIKKRTCSVLGRLRCIQ